MQGAPNPSNCYQSQFLALIMWITFILCELLECMISLLFVVVYFFCHGNHYNEEDKKNGDEGTFDEDVQLALAPRLHIVE